MSDSVSSLQPSRKPRTLVVCLDGTANEYSGEDTNVVRFFSLLKKDDANEQLCYYQAGIGTYFAPGVVSPIFQWCAKILDEAVAWYLDAHVMDGYQFLMQNYCIGDKICIFGFSRGAYTARALAGMLHKIGLLPRDNIQQINFAYKLYTRTDPANLELARGFKQTFCQSVEISFVGVWDTVASVGVIMCRTLPFTNSNTAIKVFRHALSLDEHRVRFRPSYYHRTAPNLADAALDPEHASPVINSDIESADKKKPVLKRTNFFRRLKPKSIARARSASNTPPSTAVSAEDPADVLEVWFAGCHADVGGGAIPDSPAPTLAEITLRWMVREAMAAQCGLLFDDAALARCGVPMMTFPPATAEHAGAAELALDALDALQPLHDQLVEDPVWWALEVVPIKFAWQDRRGAWRERIGLHMGRGRYIVDAHPKFHVTVKQRMSDAVLKYTPKARWRKGSEVYVE